MDEGIATLTRIHKPKILTCKSSVLLCIRFFRIRVLIADILNRHHILQKRARPNLSWSCPGRAVS